MPRRVETQPRPSNSLRGGIMITELISKVTGNPWFLVAALGLGLASGGAGAWYVQGLRLDAVKAEYKGFLTRVDIEGKAAAKEAERVTAANKLNKTKADDENKIAINLLNADIERLRNARTRRGYVPAAPASSGRPDLACFDRGSLEQALRQFDEEVNGLVAEGDQNAVMLSTGRLWASRIHN